MSILILLFTFTVWAENHQPKIDKIIQLQQEIEWLQKELSQQQDHQRAELDQLFQKKLELQNQWDKEHQRQLKMQSQLISLQSGLNKKPQQSQIDSKIFIGWLESYKNIIQQLIPYETERRLAHIKNMEDRLKKGVEFHGTILNDWVQFLKNEVAIATSNESKVMNIKQGEQNITTEVARLGFYGLFALHPNGQSFSAIKKDDTWVWQDLKEPNYQDSLKLLVQHLKNNNTPILYQIPVFSDKRSAGL